MLVRSLCVALSSTVLLAQNYSPVHFGGAEGPANNVYPFGITTVPFRYSQIHDDVPLMVITGMAFRHNWNPTAYPVHSITMDAWMSTAVTPATGMSTTFDNNHGPDKIQVVFNRTYTHVVSDPSNLPGQFVLDYPFDVPFVFLGGGASLCWEVQITAKTNTGNIVYDAVSGAASTTTGPTNPPIALGRFGTGCVSTGQTNPMGAAAAQTMSWPSGTATMTVNGTNLEPNGLTFFCMGADKTSFLGIPLPATLPGTSCTVYSDIILSSLVIASATGTGTNTIPFVPAPAYHGITLYSQIWGFDAAANPFGLTTSNAAMHHIVAPYVTPLPVRRVYASGSLAPTGSTETYTYGLVTKFY
ncbi:MAG: hypothetical protein WAT39_02205 [Planctomycetota bacterium]